MPCPCKTEGINRKEKDKIIHLFCGVFPFFLVTLCAKVVLKISKLDVAVTMLLFELIWWLPNLEKR